MLVHQIQQENSSQIPWTLTIRGTIISD
uniref:Uncharacterized protein n=1 Tax=Arundo donax TaxID=35708 RepID=A0A0A9S864_ARUDO